MASNSICSGSWCMCWRRHPLSYWQEGQHPQVNTMADDVKQLVNFLMARRHLKPNTLMNTFVILWRGSPIAYLIATSQAYPVLTCILNQKRSKPKPSIASWQRKERRGLHKIKSCAWHVPRTWNSSISTIQSSSDPETKEMRERARGPEEGVLGFLTRDHIAMGGVDTIDTNNYVEADTTSWNRCTWIVILIHV